MSKNNKENILIVSISKWKQTSTNQVEYYIQLHSEISNKNWEIVHNLEEFNKFHQYLLLNFTGLPLFPEISFAYLNLQKTKILLEMYISEILQRDDILGNPQTEIFFDLKKNHFCDFYLYQPTLILIDLKSSYLIRVKELDIFISFFKNEISILDFDLEIQKNFKIINKIILKDEISCIKYRVAEHRHYLLVGFVTGVIYLYRINDKNKIPKQLFGEKSKKFELDKRNEVKPHKSKILFLDYIPSTGYIFSSSQNAGLINISEINYEKIISSMKTPKGSSIAGFGLDNENRLAYVVDSLNSLYVYDIRDINSIIMLQGYHEADPGLSILQIINEINFIFIGNTTSEASMYYFDCKANKIQKIARVSCDKNKRFSVIGMHFNTSKNELIISLTNGKIQFWSIDENNPIYVIDCCDKHKYGICYYEEKNVLISNCDEKTVKIYRLPKLWIGEVLKMKLTHQEELKSIFEINNKEEITRIVENNCGDQEEDNYDSSLDGWDIEEKDNDVIGKMLDLQIDVI